MSTDKIVIIRSENTRISAWVDALKENKPDLDVQVYPDDTEREKTEFVLVWNPPLGVFKKYPNLKVIASMGAGINHITKDPELPKNVKITKVNDPLLRKDLAVYVLATALDHLRNFNLFKKQQANRVWNREAYQRPEDTVVGILGLGAIGQEIGQFLVKNGFSVTGWSRSPKNLDGITSFHGPEQKDEFLKTAGILVCMLPLTEETRGILNTDLFEKLPQNAYLINVGRGGHLVEKDLSAALKNEKLSGAALDVFQEEPLPEDHPFWTNEKIQITPHTASVTDPKSVSKTVLKNLQRLKNGEDLEDVIDVSRGY